MYIRLSDCCMLCGHALGTPLTRETNNHNNHFGSSRGCLPGSRSFCLLTVLECGVHSLLHRGSDWIQVGQHRRCLSQILERWKDLEEACFCCDDAMIDVTAAAMPVDATQPAFPCRFQPLLGEGCGLASCGFVPSAWP